jgi:hypothetical protein
VGGATRFFSICEIEGGENEDGDEDMDVDVDEGITEVKTLP